jgi:hypothetical protein
MARLVQVFGEFADANRADDVDRREGMGDEKHVHRGAALPG